MRFAWSRNAISLAAASTLLALAGCGGGSILFDPEPYRAHIEGLEAILQKPAADPGDGAKMFSHAAELAGDLGLQIENARRKETVKSLLIDFGQSVSDEEASGGSIDMAAARQRWHQMRDSLFEQADWFR